MGILKVQIWKDVNNKVFEQFHLKKREEEGENGAGLRNVV